MANALTNRRKFPPKNPNNRKRDNRAHSLQFLKIKKGRISTHNLSIIILKVEMRPPLTIICITSTHI